MSREEFYNIIKKTLMLFKPEEMVITFITVSKQNGTEWPVFMLSMPDITTSPFFFLEDLYNAYRRGRSIPDIIAGVIELSMNKNCAVIADETDVLDYENIRKNLGLMVIDATVNRECLENIVHENIEDLALVPIIFINNQHDDECIKIKYEYLKVWWVTGFMVMEEAKKNALHVMPLEVNQKQNIRKEYLKPRSDGVYLPEEASKIFTISNNYHRYGASAVFYPCFLEGFSKGLGKDLFILPISVDKIYIIKDLGQDPVELLRFVEDMHRTVVAPEDVLPDAVYYYSGSSGFRKILPIETKTE